MGRVAHFRLRVGRFSLEENYEKYNIVDVRLVSPSARHRAGKAAGHGLDTNGDDLPISANGIQALSISGSDGSVTFQKSVTFQQPPILSTGVGCTPALKGSVQLTASNGLSVCNGSAWISPTPTSGFTLVKICSTATIAACTPTAASSQTNNDLTGLHRHVPQEHLHT